jgi:hypothetical protein
VGDVREVPEPQRAGRARRPRPTVGLRRRLGSGVVAAVTAGGDAGPGGEQDGEPGDERERRDRGDS